MSRSIAILIAALASSARAQSGAAVSAASEVEQAEPAYPPPPPVYEPQVVPPLPAPRPPRPPGPTGFERRQHVGAQIGGTGVAQIVYRIRVAGPVHLEVGGLGIHGANVSAGAVVGRPARQSMVPPTPVSVAGSCSAGTPKCDATKTDATKTDCPNERDESFAFLHARVGVGVALGASRRSLVSFDVGGWYGTHDVRETDSAGGKTEWSKRVAMPMAGVSYFFAIH